MTAMPCEKQLLIAAIMSVALVFPVVPFYIFLAQGILLMPEDVSMIVDAGHAEYSSFSVLVYLLLPIHVVATILFLFTHYCSCFLLPSICCCCYKTKYRKCDDFFWIRKDVLDNYKEEVAQNVLNLQTYKKVFRTTLSLEENDDFKPKKIELTLWIEGVKATTNTNEVIAMKTPGDIVLDQKLGGYLLALRGDVPTFDNFYVCRCDDCANPETRLEVP